LIFYIYLPSPSLCPPYRTAKEHHVPAEDPRDSKEAERSLEGDFTIGECDHPTFPFLASLSLP
jgi:hypothetical protein